MEPAVDHKRKAADLRVGRTGGLCPGWLLLARPNQAHKLKSGVARINHPTTGPGPVGGAGGSQTAVSGRHAAAGAVAASTGLPAAAEQHQPTVSVPQGCSDAAGTWQRQ